MAYWLFHQRPTNNENMLRFNLHGLHKRFGRLKIQLCNLPAGDGKKAAACLSFILFALSLQPE